MTPDLTAAREVFDGPTCKACGGPVPHLRYGALGRCPAAPPTSTGDPLKAEWPFADSHPSPVQPPLFRDFRVGGKGPFAHRLQWFIKSRLDWEDENEDRERERYFESQFNSMRQELIADVEASVAMNRVTFSQGDVQLIRDAADEVEWTDEAVSALDAVANKIEMLARDAGAAAKQHPKATEIRRFALDVNLCVGCERPTICAIIQKGTAPCGLNVLATIESAYSDLPAEPSAGAPIDREQNA